MYPPSYEQQEATYEQAHDETTELLNNVLKEEGIGEEFAKWLKKNQKIIALLGSRFEMLIEGTEDDMTAPEMFVAIIGAVWIEAYKIGRRAMFITILAWIIITLLVVGLPIIINAYF